MLEIEDQLRRYGEALEHHLLGGQVAGEPDVESRPVDQQRRSPRRPLAIAALVVVVVLAAAAGVLATWPDDEPEVRTQPGPTATDATLPYEGTEFEGTACERHRAEMAHLPQEAAWVLEQLAAGRTPADIMPVPGYEGERAVSIGFRNPIEWSVLEPALAAYELRRVTLAYQGYGQGTTLQTSWEAQPGETFDVDETAQGTAQLMEQQLADAGLSPGDPPVDERTAGIAATLDRLRSGARPVPSLTVASDDLRPLADDLRSIGADVFSVQLGGNHAWGPDQTTADYEARVCSENSEEG